MLTMGAGTLRDDEASGDSADGDSITVFLADDNVIVREGVRALLALEPDLEIVGTAADYDELVAGAEKAAPQVLVTDIRMPPNFQSEGIDAAKELRKRHPGHRRRRALAVRRPRVRDRAARRRRRGLRLPAQGPRSPRATSSPGRCARSRPAARCSTRRSSRRSSGRSAPTAGSRESEEALLQMVAEGKPIKAIAAAQHTTPAAVADAVEDLFLKLSQGASAGATGSLRRLRMLHQAIVDREEQGETLSRLLPGGVAEMLRQEGRRIGETEELVVTVLMSDIRGYSAIAERADPSQLAGQLNEHRAEMNHAILDNGGTVMQFVGDAVMACFGAPVPSDDHADRALAAAIAMHERQAVVNDAVGGARA